MDPINNLGDSASFDMGDMGNLGDMSDMGAGMQPDASAVRIFSPDDGGNVANAFDPQQATKAAAPAATAAAPAATAATTAAPAATAATPAASSSTGSTASTDTASKSDKLTEAGKIMDLIGSVISAAKDLASPILNLITSLASKAGTTGASTT